MIKTIPKKKKCKNTKQVSEEALQIAEKRSERQRRKGKIYPFECRVPKKAFLSDQCKEMEENKRMGKTRDLFKEIEDTKGTFHAKMGSIKEKYVFLELFCFFRDPVDVANLISGSSAFPKTSLNIWKFMVPRIAEAWLGEF